jgi:FkbM family methyltransferase
MNFRTISFQTYFAARDLRIAHLLRRFPYARRWLVRLRVFLLPQNPVWVKVRSGISQGLWLKLHIPDEARFWRGEHELDVQRAIAAAVCSGSVIYDIGAHAGSIALGLGRLVGPSGCVIAFEADPHNVDRLKECLVRNKLMNTVQVVPSAVWSYSASQISFRSGGAQRAHGGVEADGCRSVLGTGELINVPTVALDDFVAKGRPIPQVVKIDVEGGEYEVLRGAAMLFTRERPLVIAEIHNISAANQISSWLAQHSYGSHWIVPKEGFPRSLFAWPEQYNGAAWMSRVVGKSPLSSHSSATGTLSKRCRASEPQPSLP